MGDRVARNKFKHSVSSIYYRCGARSRDNVPGLRFHALPVKDKDRCAMWLVNTGRDDMTDETDANLRKLAVCGKHFPENAVFQKSGWLRRDAVPLPFEPDFERDVDEILSLEMREESERKQHVLRGGLEVQHASISRLKSENAILRKRVKAKNERIKRLEKCLNEGNFSDESLIKALYQRLQGFLLTFVMMQLFHKPGHAFTEEQRQLSMRMHYTSPSLYSKMRNQLGFVLPSISVIKEWFSLIHLWPGICSTLFQSLKTKASVVTAAEKNCVLIFDEMKIKKGLDFHETLQKIEGFEDLGSLGCSPGVACTALVFMLRGLMCNWKQPVAYVLSAHKAVSATDLSILVDMVINEAMKAGFTVRAISRDQGPANQSAVHARTSDGKPYFTLNGAKIYTFFDFPHLFKSLRNQLILHNIKLDEDTEVSWHDLEDLYNLEKDKNTRAACKLTHKHVYPELFDKMKCRLALQVFSRRVSAALSTASTTGQIASNTVMHTTNFFQLLNDLFDNLNSQVATDPNVNKCAISRFRPTVKGNREQALNEIPNWRTVTKNGLKVPPCFRGLQTSITATLQLWEDMEAEGAKFLLTARLNQDPAENLFSMIRTYGGSFNPNPTAKSFRQILQKNMMLNLIRLTQSANCIDDEDEILVQRTISELRELNRDRASQIANLLNEGCSVDVNSQVPSIGGIIDEDDESSEESLEMCATEYFAGYIGRRCVARTNCERCCEKLLDESQQLERSEQVLIFFRAYETADDAELGHLCAPTVEFSFVFRLLNAVFDNIFPSIKGNYGLLDAIFRVMVTAVDKRFPHWFDDEMCKEHRKSMVYDMMTVKVRKVTKWQSDKDRIPKKKGKRIRHCEK